MAKKKSLEENHKRRAFTEEFPKDLNQTEAAKRAGYAETNAKFTASNLMKKPEVRAAIQKKMDERSARTEVTADKILLGILDLAELDIGDAYDSEGRLLNVKDMPTHVRKAISSIKVFEEFEGSGQDRIQVGVVREVKFEPRNPNYALLGRHLKLFADKLEVSFAEGLADKVARARKRATGNK